MSAMMIFGGGASVRGGAMSYIFVVAILRPAAAATSAVALSGAVSDGRTDGRTVTEANSSIAMVNSATTSQVADVSSVAVCLIHSAS